MSTPLSLDPDRAGRPRRRLPGARPLSDGTILYWWREVLYVMVVNFVYEAVRNSNEGGRTAAYENARRIMDWQEILFINHEEAIQEAVLGARWLIIASNYFYGSAYILMTIFVLVFLYRRFSDSYPLWRNTLAATTLLGLFGFRFFPLMPPRLLDVEGPGIVYGFVDTLKSYPTFWSFESDTMAAISNQYAAMPSLHCAWALWGALALWPHVRSWWARVLVVAYPVATVTVVVLTGNHFFLDAVGGAVIVAGGYTIARWRTRAGRGAPLLLTAAASADI